MDVRKTSKYTAKSLVECSYCKRMLRKSDATKIELLFVGRRSRHIVHNVKYYHPLHYNKMMCSLSWEVYEKQEENLRFESEKFKLLGPHLTRPDRERLALGGLVFDKLVLSLNTGLDDALDGQASVKIKIRPARGYILYNKWMLTKC